MAVRRRSTAPPGWLYLVIVLILGATLLIGVVSWIWLAFENDDMPDGLATLLATVAGGLVGALTMNDARGARRDDDRE
jgi:hypothetical protein